jgi:hypothetical protein
MWVRSRVFDPGAWRQRSLRNSRRRDDDDRREYECEADGGENRPGKTSRRSEEEGKRASARGAKAAVPCRAVPCAAVPSARAKKRCRARPGRAAESPLAGPSAARYFRAAAKIAARLARENARVRGRMDETQVGDARSAALVARLRGGMPNPSNTWRKSIKNTRDTRKRSRVTLFPAASPHGASVPLGGRRARSNWTPSSWSAPPAEFLSACAGSSRAS